MTKLQSLFVAGVSVLTVLSACTKKQATPGQWTFVQSVTVPDENEDKAGLNMAGFLDANHGLAILAHDGVIRYTSDGGKRWLNAESVPGDLVALELLDGHHAYASGGPYVRSSLAGWLSWKELPGHGAGGQASRFLSFFDTSSGWFATSDGLDASRDGGESWAPITLPAEAKGAVTAVHLRSENDGYVLYSDGILYATADGGKTWRPIRPPFAGREPLSMLGFAPTEAVRFTDASNGVLVEYQEKPERGFHAFRTADGGAHWVEDQLPADKLPKLGSVFLSRDGQWLTTTDIDSCAISVFKRELPAP